MTIPLRWALLFVTTVKSFLGLEFAVSNAKRMTRSTAWRVKMETSVAVSQANPAFGASQNLGWTYICVLLERLTDGQSQAPE